jgi:hypothetical protein
MQSYYVRPQCDAGYGRGDGTSYDDAWNGFAAVDWSRLSGSAAQPTLWVCGGPDGAKGFLTLNVEWSFLSDDAPNPFGLGAAASQ